jgi:hypothetical protein
MQNSFNNIRWLSCRNATSPGETIPGFALMRIAGQEEMEGQVVFRVAQPDAESERAQDPAGLLINGPTPIPAGMFGAATQDFPARVLHATSDAGSNAAALMCGPRQNSWKAWRSGRAFAVVAADPSESSVPSGDELLWITRAAFEPIVYDAALRTSLTEIPSGGAIAPLADAYRDPASSGQAQGVYANASGLSFTRSGSYLAGFSLSLYSASAPRGSQLTVRLYYDGAPTQYSAVRAQDIERDEYGANVLTTLENVCQAGPLAIAAGKTLELRNESNYPIIATPVTLWAALLFEHTV